MTHPVPADLWIATVAAIAVVGGAVVGALWREAPREARVVAIAGLAGWLGLDVALGAAGAFAAEPNRLVPGIVAGVAVPIAAGAWLLGRGGRIGRLVGSVSVRTIVGVQAYRVAGVVFIIAWLQGRVPGVFAVPAGVGDVAVGLAAPFVAAGVAARRHSTRACAAWNALGVLDLALAVTLGALTSPSPFQAFATGDPNYLISRLPLVLIPVFAVPLSVLLHLATARRLRAAGPLDERVRAGTASPAAPPAGRTA